MCDAPGFCGLMAIRSAALLLSTPPIPESKTGETQETPQARQLVRISEIPYHWYSQKSGLRLAAFAEPYPALPKGYGLRLR